MQAPSSAAPQLQDLERERERERDLERERDRVEVLSAACIAAQKERTALQQILESKVRSRWAEWKVGHSQMVQ